jgi:regulation of enolase protein 1 (concanavalin A-like superfamily)
MKTVFRFLIGIHLMLNSGSVFSQEVELPSIPFKLRWEYRPNHFAVEGNTLTIVAGEKTDMFRDPNVTYNTDNAPKLLFTPDEDFVLTASIHHTFKEKWDGGAIVLKTDSLNWVKFCYEKDYTGARRVVSVVTRNISDDCNSVSFPTDKAFFKVAKAGPVITLYCSADGKSWLLVRHFQLEKHQRLSVGFLAQSPMGKDCSVDFSDIKYERKKISDPYTGN